MSYIDPGRSLTMALHYRTSGTLRADRGSWSLAFVMRATPNAADTLEAGIPRPVMISFSDVPITASTI